jgi:hypothetical protein
VVAGDRAAGGTLVAAGGGLEGGEVIVAVGVAVAWLAVERSRSGLGEASGARLHQRLSPSVKAVCRAQNAFYRGAKIPGDNAAQNHGHA